MGDELVTVRNFASEIDANLAKTLLDSEGVFSAVFKDDAGGMEPHFQLTRGVDLKVRKSDLEKAQEILSEE